MSTSAMDKPSLNIQTPQPTSKHHLSGSRSPGKKPGTITFHSPTQHIPENRCVDDVSTIFTHTSTQEDIEIIQNYLEPLRCGPFTLELVWDLAKEKFGSGQHPTPRFLAIIDRLLTQNILEEAKYLEDMKTYIFISCDSVNDFSTKDTVWEQYYTHWARYAAHLNSMLGTNEIISAFIEYSCFKPHFQKLFKKLLIFDIKSSADTTIQSIGRHLGGCISELCVAMLPPPQGARLTHALMNICSSESLHVAPTGAVNAHVMTRSSLLSIAARIDHARMQRINGHFEQSCDTLYGAVVSVRQLPRSERSREMLTEALLHLALSQHEQLDRTSEDEYIADATRENVRCLYEEVLTLCQDSPRTLHPSPVIYILKGRALTGLARLLAALDDFEEAHLQFARALECIRRVVHSPHPLMVDTLLGLSALEKDEGNVEAARKHLTEAGEVFMVLNKVAGECSAYPLSMAKCWNSIALLLDDEDKFGDAVEGYLRAQSLFSDLLGNDCLAVADIAMNLGTLYTSLGEHRSALSSFQRAANIYKLRYGAQGSDTLSATQSLAECRNALEMDEAHHRQDFGEDSRSIGTESTSLSAAELQNSLAAASAAVEVKQSEGTDIDALAGGGCADNAGGSPEELDFPNETTYLCGLLDQPSRRVFPQEVVYLMVQAELMWANEYFHEARTTYEDALLKCRQQEQVDIAAFQTRRRAAERTAMHAKVKNIVVVEDVSDGDTDDDDGHDDHKHNYDSDDVTDPGSDYIVNSASIYIAEVLLCLGDLRDAVRGGEDMSEEDPEIVEENEQEKKVVVSMYEEALAIYRVVLGEQDIRVADTLCKLGGHFANEADYEHASELFDEAMVLYRLWWKSDRARDVLEVKLMLARCMQGQRLFAEANELSDEVLSAYVTIHRDEVAHTDIANALNSKGSLLQEQNSFNEAVHCYSQALEMYDVIFADEVEGSHPLIARAYNNLGSVYDDMGKFNEAKQMYEQALSILSEVHRDGHPQIAITLCNLASLMSHEGLVEEAKPLYELAVSIYKKTYGENHQSVKDTLLLLERMNGDGDGESWRTSYCVVM